MSIQRNLKHVDIKYQYNYNSQQNTIVDDEGEHGEDIWQLALLSISRLLIDETSLVPPSQL
jgi:hypothetical protein